MPVIEGYDLGRLLGHGRIDRALGSLQYSLMATAGLSRILSKVSPRETNMNLFCAKSLRASLAFRDLSVNIRVLHLR